MTHILLEIHRSSRPSAAIPRLFRRLLVILVEFKASRGAETTPFISKISSDVRDKPKQSTSAAAPLLYILCYCALAPPDKQHKQSSIKQQRAIQLSAKGPVAQVYNVPFDTYATSSQRVADRKRAQGWRKKHTGRERHVCILSIPTLYSYLLSAVFFAARRQRAR